MFLDFSLPEVPAADKKLYNEMWALLASMPNLRHLKIPVGADRCPRPVPPALQETWLGPLEQLRGKDLETFEVLVPESYARNFNIDEGSHFKLTGFQDVDRYVCYLGTGAWG
jgi:hypothetical protein